MDDLADIIKDYGKPKVIIDYPINQNGKKLIFSFLETIYLDCNLNLFINNKKINGNPLDIWQDYINKWKSKTKENDIAALGFFSYDFKNLLYSDYKFRKNSNTKTPYFWFGKPQKIIDIDNYKYNFNPQNLRLKKDLDKLEDFKNKIKEIKKYLYSGDVYQINYTQPLTFDFLGNPLDLYMQIKSTANPKYGFYLDTDKSQFLSFSPEKFFTKKSNIISSYPIKGTINKIKNKEETQIKKLSNSKKDKAEHLMIVDLLRNDIGKISKFKSVKVNDLFSIKTFETIHHMETEVQGELKESISEIEIIKSLFPGGSITGAPKYRAVQIIDKLENYNRNLYTGCIGHIQGNGNMDFNICIRTMSINNSIASYPVGGGIVWDSNPKNENLEAREKANILKYE